MFHMSGDTTVMQMVILYDTYHKVHRRLLETLQDKGGGRLKMSTIQIKLHKLCSQRRPLRHLKESRNHKYRLVLSCNLHICLYVTELKYKEKEKRPSWGLTMLRSEWSSLTISDRSSMGFSVTLPFHFLKPNWKKTWLWIKSMSHKTVLHCSHMYPKSAQRQIFPSSHPGTVIFIQRDPTTLHGKTRGNHQEKAPRRL